jgi:hypothetical protein
MPWLHLAHISSRKIISLLFPVIITSQTASLRIHFSLLPLSEVDRLSVTGKASTSALDHTRRDREARRKKPHLTYAKSIAWLCHMTITLVGATLVTQLDESHSSDQMEDSLEDPGGVGTES